jgi:hypothetical protein
MPCGRPRWARLEVPAIGLDTMIDLTVKAEVDGGIRRHDIFHAAPHTNSTSPTTK